MWAGWVDLFKGKADGKIPEESVAAVAGLPGSDVYVFGKGRDATLAKS